MSFVLKVLSTMFVFDIKGGKNEFIHKFYHNDNIVEFQNTHINNG